MISGVGGFGFGDLGFAGLGFELKGLVVQGTAFRAPVAIGLCMGRYVILRIIEKPRVMVTTVRGMVTRRTQATT